MLKYLQNGWLARLFAAFFGVFAVGFYWKYLTEKDRADELEDVTVMLTHILKQYVNADKTSTRD